MKAIVGYSDDKTVDLERFQKWLPTVPRDMLERLLADALWKGHLDNAELRRYFLVECQSGKDKTLTMVQRPSRSREYRLFRAWLKELQCQPTTHKRLRKSAKKSRKT